MPQLLPFQFLDSIVTLIVLLGVGLWCFSTVVLPLFPRLYLSRLSIVLL